MHATIEIQNGTVLAHFLDKVIKDERIFHSRVIAGQADGTLIYFDSSGHIHVVHGTGPQAVELQPQVKNAVSQIAQGVTALANLAMKAT